MLSFQATDYGYIDNLVVSIGVLSVKLCFIMFYFKIDLMRTMCLD
jgi:hypothetical protein